MTSLRGVNFDSGFRMLGVRFFTSRFWVRASLVIVGAVVLAVFFSGFLNLVDIRGYYPATLILDGLTAFMIVAVVVAASVLFWRKFAFPPSWISALIAVTLVYIGLSFFGEERLLFLQSR